MLELDDSVLLKEYVEHGSEEAFATLVARHLNKVYSIALRHTGNAHQAEEITQAAFVLFARKSRKLGQRVILSGWLCRAARLLAVTFVRSELRRTRREQEAHMQNLLNEGESDVWPQIAPLLDAAMAGLSESDHDAVALRFFDGKSMREIGAALGASEDAAKMRVSRAVEKLRLFFTRRGIACPAAALTAAISAHSVQAAPAVLAKAVTTAAIANGAAASASTLTLVKGALNMMAWAKARMPIVASAVVLTVVGTIVAVMKAGADEQEVRKPGADEQVRKPVADEHGDESWRIAGLTWQQVGQTAPQIKILPTKFQLPVYHMLTSGGVKRGGINVSVREIIWAAYRCGPGRMVFTAGEPQEKYDFISTLPLGTEQALQGEVKKVLGLTGRWREVETNVLALKVRARNAAGLKPAAYSPSESGDLRGGRIRCSGQPLSYKPGMPPWGLTKQLERIFHEPIVDETGLEGSYSLDLRWKVKTDPAANREAVEKALLDQLGLELVYVQKSLELLFVEKVR